jgi:hypothetical protein
MIQGFDIRRPLDTGLGRQKSYENTNQGKISFQKNQRAIKHTRLGPDHEIVIETRNQPRVVPGIALAGVNLLNRWTQIGKM